MNVAACLLAEAYGHLCAIGSRMNLHEAARELRSLDLPIPRQRQLTLEAAHSPSGDARALIVARARHEAKRAAQERTEAVKADIAARWRLAQERAAFEPQPVVRRPAVDDRSMDGPVRISWTTPRKPELVRPPRRAEVIGANRKPRTKKPLPDSLEVVEVVEIAKPKKIREIVAGVTIPDIKHGIRGYNVHKCRCIQCKQAKRDSRNSKGRTPKSIETIHGTLTTYVRERCRCEPCRAASSEYNRARYAARKALKEENTK